MTLLETVQKHLKEQQRSMIWLAAELDRSPDGLSYEINIGRLSYNKLLAVARVLKIKPAMLFADLDEECK